MSADISQRSINNSRHSTWMPDAQLRFVSTARILHTLKVEEIARVRAHDYKYLDRVGAGGRAILFNLPLSEGGKNTLLALPRLVKPGFLIGGNEVLPELSFEQVWRGIVVRQINSIPYEKIPPCFLGACSRSTPIGDIQDVASLQSVILQRYSQSLPGRDILAEGVGIRLVRLTDRVSLNGSANFGFHL